MPGDHLPPARRSLNKADAGGEAALDTKYPYICTTGLKMGVHTHTQFRTLPWIREMEPEPFSEIHPRTAARLAIAEGDRMRIRPSEGAATVRARVRATVQPRVVAVAFGYGKPYAGDDEPTDAITSQKARDPISGAAGNRSFPVAIERIEEPGHGFSSPGQGKNRTVLSRPRRSPFRKEKRRREMRETLPAAFSRPTEHLDIPVVQR